MPDTPAETDPRQIPQPPATPDPVPRPPGTEVPRSPEPPDPRA